MFVRLVRYAFVVFFLSFQTEIAKRLNAICAQIIPFLSMDVSTNVFRRGRSSLAGHARCSVT